MIGSVPVEYMRDRQHDMMATEFQSTERTDSILGTHAQINPGAQDSHFRQLFFETITSQGNPFYSTTRYII